METTSSLSELLDSGEKICATVSVVEYEDQMYTIVSYVSSSKKYRKQKLILKYEIYKFSEDGFVDRDLLGRFTVLDVPYREANKVYMLISGIDDAICSAIATGGIQVGDLSKNKKLRYGKLMGGTYSGEKQLKVVRTL